MALPQRKAGGLYGGIQFSSGISFTPSTVKEPVSTYETQEEKKEETVVVQLAKPEETKAPEAGSSKTTAGIHLSVADFALMHCIKK